MHYEVSRKRLYNSPEDHPYCLTIFLENGIKAQYPAKSETEAEAQYRDFLRFQADDLSEVDEGESPVSLFSGLRPYQLLKWGWM